jgi:ribosome assembly protein 3
VETNSTPSPAREVVEAPAPIDSPPKSAKKEKKKKSQPAQEIDGDTPMEDAEAAPTPASTPASIKKSKSDAKVDAQFKEDFTTIYLRKIAAELADDLDKVREAQDFKASSVPMLIHALKQGEKLFSVEEKRRVIGAASG